MNSTDIELELVNYFNHRANLIIPNVSWGFNIHECDLLIVSRAGFITEVEIKISKSDIKADLKKGHKHNDHRIKRLFFAIPYYLKDCADLIPEHAGIINIDNRDWPERPRRPRVMVSRQAKNNSVYKCTLRDRYDLARLGAIRIWDLKHTVRDRVEELDRLNAKMKALGIQTEMYF